MSAIVFNYFMLLVLCVTTNGQRITIVRQTTTTTTLTCTSTDKTNCFSINSAAGPVTQCRKRRQIWVEEPIFLMAPPDEQMFIQPTNTFQVEPTAVPMDWFKSDYFYPEFNGDAYLHPSIHVPVNDYPHNLYMNLLTNGAYRNGQIQRQSSRTRRRTTLFYTKTRTITANEMSTKTNTIAITGCTPSPLPYDVCPP